MDQLSAVERANAIKKLEKELRDEQNRMRLKAPEATYAEHERVLSAHFAVIERINHQIGQLVNGEKVGLIAARRPPQKAY